MAALAPSLTHLDASGSLLAGWPAAVRVAAALPRLARLDASRCAALGPAGPPPPPPPVAPSDAVFAGLATLVLGHTGVDWQRVCGAKGWGGGLL